MTKSVSTEELEARAEATPLSHKDLELMHAYWRACNYLSVDDSSDDNLPQGALEKRTMEAPAAGLLGRESGVVRGVSELMIVEHDLDRCSPPGPATARLSAGD